MENEVFSSVEAKGFSAYFVNIWIKIGWLPAKEETIVLLCDPLDIGEAFGDIVARKGYSYEFDTDLTVFEKYLHIF